MQLGRKLYWSWQSYTLYYEENKNLLFSEMKPLTNNSSLYKQYNHLWISEFHFS